MTPDQAIQAERARVLALIEECRTDPWAKNNSAAGVLRVLENHVRKGKTKLETKHDD